MSEESAVAHIKTNEVVCDRKYCDPGSTTEGNLVGGVVQDRDGNNPRHCVLDEDQAKHNALGVRFGWQSLGDDKYRCLSFGTNDSSA